MASYEFTADEEIQAFNHEDKGMDLTGYVDMIDGMKVLKTAQGHVLKFVLKNASNSQMRVLIWGTSLAKKYESLIRLNAIVENTGGSIKLSIPAFRSPNEKVALHEYHVQPHSTIHFHGEYKSTIANPAITFQSTSFDEVMIVDGPIEILGYMKSNGFVEVKTPNSSYGQGVIANGQYRLTVQIASFQADDRVSKGVHLRLRGVMQKQAEGGLRIADMNAIDILEDSFLTWQ